MFVSDGIYYRKKNDYLVICGVAEIIKSDIVIPNEINGCPIKEVDVCAFQNVSELDSISFSSTIDVIGEKAFYRCKNLKHVCFLGTSLQSVKIKELAFAHCEQLESINGDVSLVLDGTFIFSKCYALTKMPLQLNGEIPMGTFAGCRNLKILIFYKVDIVEKTAFLDCKNIEKVFILNDFKYGDDFLDDLKNAQIICKLESNFAELAYKGYKIVSLSAFKQFNI